MAKLSIKDLDLDGMRVFIRVDFNVPIKEGRLGDDTRIRSSLPTISYALEHGATLCTDDLDFRRFKGLKIDLPLRRR